MARNMIDLIGRAAERVNLNATDRLDGDAASSRGPGAQDPGARLEPTILASLAEDRPAAPEAVPAATDAPRGEPSSFMDSFADAQTTHDAATRERAIKIASANAITLDWTALAKSGFLTPHNQNSLKAEEFRTIKRPLLRTAFGAQGKRLGHGHALGVDGNAHVVMITSPQPGDGKTFNAINLAVSIAAEHDLQVLLIDADIRSRGLSRTLGLEDRPGLTDLLAQKYPSAETVTLRTDMPSLSIIPAGSPMTGASEMMASQAMTRLVHEIATGDKNRFVIFDAPPVLVSSEPGVLAGHVGQVLMVARANETCRRAVADALAQVNACPTINFILNQVSRSVVPQRFGYYGYAAAE